MISWGPRLFFRKKKSIEGTDGAHSFKTGRYLGPEGDQVYETRILSLVQKPSPQCVLE